MKLTSNPSRRVALGVFVFAAAAAASRGALAYDENSPAPINLAQHGVALHGYDPVSYFTGATPVKGNPGITARHEGAIYHFASTASRDKFSAAPARYAPQFGGFCAMGVVFGKKLDVDPAAYKVVDGKLYLNLSKDVQNRWLDDVPGNIATAEKSWPALKDKVPKGL